MGHPTTFYEGPFSVESTCRIIRDYGITNLAGSPTAYRLLMAAGAAAETALKGRLRAVSSAGEPLTPEVIRWFADRLGTTIHDHYGQTELGMVLCNHHALAHPVRVGAAGFACPGHRVVVLDDDLNELPPGQPGILALDRRRSPLMWFPGYQGLETAAFVGDYYLSGDTVELNEDGSISFVGRADDVITTSGYRVGPFDVESALIEHPAVMEAAVIGKPDPERTELVKAFVVLCAGHRPTPELADELQRYVRQRLSAHAYPREIEFLEELPKTPAARSSAFSCATRRSPGNARRPHRRPPRTDSAGENDVRIENRVFLVTGGSSGLGAATAKMLVEQGGKVVLADINAEAGAAKAAELGAQARFVRADIASEADGRQAVATALEAFGGLHGLANCAGVAPAEKVLGRNGIHALESFRRVIDINLVGSFNMLRLAAEAMSQGQPDEGGERG